MVCLDRPYHLKFIKGCLPQILVGPFLNTLTHTSVAVFLSNSAASILRYNQLESEFHKISQE